MWAEDPTETELKNYPLILFIDNDTYISYISIIISINSNISIIIIIDNHIILVLIFIY